MGFRGALALTLLVACRGSNETSSAGPVGRVINLRGRMSKPEVAARAPTDERATKREFSLDVHGVQAKVVWRTLEDSGAKYILSAGWEVVTPKNGVTLEPLGTLNPVNAGTEASPVQGEIMIIRWHDNTVLGSKWGDLSVRIDANGGGKQI